MAKTEVSQEKSRMEIGEPDKISDEYFNLMSGLAGSTSPKVYLCSNCLAERVSGHGDTCPRCTAIADLHSETLGVSEFTYRLMIAVSMLAAVAVLLAAFLYLGQI